jgi:hypothetical protein
MIFINLYPIVSEVGENFCETAMSLLQAYFILFFIMLCSLFGCKSTSAKIGLKTTDYKFCTKGEDNPEVKVTVLCFGLYA